MNPHFTRIAAFQDIRDIIAELSQLRHGVC